MKISVAQPPDYRSRVVAAACILFVVAVGLPAFPAGSAAEEEKVLNVCIPQHSGKDALLSQLANTISSHKPDRNTHIRLKGVQLGSIDQILVTDNPFKGNQANQTLSAELRDRAIQEHCDYILVVSLPDISTARSPQPDVASPNIQSTTNTYDPYMRRQDPENYVRVKYQLYARDPAKSPSEGFVTTHDAAPYQAVVAQALDLLGNQVFAKLAK
jgi:hypothetical protein